MDSISSRARWLPTERERQRSHRWDRAFLAATLLGVVCEAACGQTGSEQPGVPMRAGASNADGEGSAGARGGARPGANSDAGVAGQGGGAPPHVPGQTEEEADVLGLLFDEAAVDRSSGEALAGLAVTIALAEGYAVCRCSFPANALPANPIELLSTCARGESGSLGRLPQDDGVRCLSEALLEDPALEEPLRCSIRQYMEYGRAWLEACWGRRDSEPGKPPPGGPATCPIDELDSLVFGCTIAHHTR